MLTLYIPALSAIEIDNDEQGVIGDFTTISDIRSLSDSNAVIVVKSPITPSSELSFYCIKTYLHNPNRCFCDLPFGQGHRQCVTPFFLLKVHT